MAMKTSTSESHVIKKHDVFISFRGEDTRSNFISHLHDALKRSYIQTYIDYRIQKGKQVWNELQEAIQDSNLFLVVLSDNYASSTWCLNELVEIMECCKNGQVIPVFYCVDPSHVRKQIGSYQTALNRHKKKHGKEMIQKWKDALFQVANFSGFHSTTYKTESELIEDIIKTLLGKLNHKYTNELRGHFIADQNFSHIESLMKIGSREVRIIGIWGMGGVGKTTLAAAVFQKLSSQYEGSCFLENVKEESKRHGLNYICNKLLSKLLSVDLDIDTSKVIPSLVMRRLKGMKVLIVLDDVHTSDLLENLIGEGCEWLGDGSRVIVTSRDKQVLISGGVDEIHQVKEMNSQNSLRLFSLNAFKKVLPKEGYEEVSRRAVDYAKGIPLALKVLGSFLRSKSEKEWDSALNKLKDVPNIKIQKVLRLSYDELDDTEQNIFLDIACFFKGHGRNEVTKILNACGFFADIGIRNLLDKALVTITSYNDIQMHDLIQEMGKEIVRQESIKNPGRRSRLCDPNEVYDVLRNNKGTSAVEGIWLDMDHISYLNLSSKVFENMPNLRLLAFQDLKGTKSVYLPSGLDLTHISLRYFRWDGYPLKSLPSSFFPEMLVELSMRESNVEKLWNGILSLPSLEILDLSGSKYLIECPNLSGAPNIKYVKFNTCQRLTLVDPSVFALPKLDTLDVGGCISLKMLSSDTCSPSLKQLHALGCFNLQEFSVTLMPSISSTNIWCLSLGWWGLNKIPSSILHIRNLEIFYFPISDSLMDLPENFTYAFWLFDPWKNECDILITLHKVLPSPAFLTVRYLIFDGCNTLFEIPDNICLLSSLKSLILCNCAIISFPQTIKDLPLLIHLDVGKCNMLQSIPVLPLSVQGFRVWNCESLHIVSCSMSGPSEISKYGFLLLNSIELDPHSHATILEDAIVRIELGARLHSAISKNMEDASSDHDGDDHDFYRIYTISNGIWYFLPTISNKIQDWFHYHSTQALISVELPSNLSGFVCYMVLSQGHIDHGGDLGCECYFETSLGERINTICFGIDQMALWLNVNGDGSFGLLSDHVLLWYDAQYCQQIMDAVEVRKAINNVSTNYNPNLTFRFFVETPYDEVEVKQCGFRWIYNSEDQTHVEEEGWCETKRSWEIHELEPKAVQNRAEESESNEEEENIALEVDQETKDLRCLLEELLHIGFGGDLMK